MIRTQSKALACILFSTLAGLAPWAMAAGEPAGVTPARIDKPRCADNSPACRVSATSSDVAQAFIRHARKDACPDDAQDCAARAKIKRNQVDDEVRDRHACRD